MSKPGCATKVKMYMSQIFYACVDIWVFLYISKLCTLSEKCTLHYFI